MKAIVVANWKMHPASFREAKRLLEVTKRATERAHGVSVIIAPPSIFLRELRKVSHGKKISFAAQSAHFENVGAHTGEISMHQVKDARVPYVLIGHAERRAAGESNEDTRKKIVSALANGITPILCVGEKERSHSGEHFTTIRDQLRTAFMDVQPQKVSRVLIAYEPVWAIGAQTAMSPRDMHEMAIFIRKTIVELHGEAGHALTILYGGSVEEKNAGDMVRHGDVKGLLVGRASEEAVRMIALLQALGETK